MSAKTYKKVKVGAEIVYGGANVFEILGTIKRQIQKEYGHQEASDWLARATSQRSYNEVLIFCEETVTVG